MQNCVMCNKRLETWFEGECCSPRCRKKKSRDKLMASPRSHKIAFEIDAIGRTIRLQNMNKEEAEELMYTIWRSMSKLIDQVRAISTDGALSHEEDQDTE